LLRQRVATATLDECLATGPPQVWGKERISYPTNAFAPHRGD